MSYPTTSQAPEGMTSLETVLKLFMNSEFYVFHVFSEGSTTTYQLRFYEHTSYKEPL